jgi:hypothetical protein
MGLDFKAGWQYFCNMALTVEMVTQAALGLPDSGRASLVESLPTSLAGEINPTVEVLTWMKSVSDAPQCVPAKGASSMAEKDCTKSDPPFTP